MKTNVFERGMCFIYNSHIRMYVINTGRTVILIELSSQWFESIYMSREVVGL